jgi:hypothetical protein
VPAIKINAPSQKDQLAVAKAATTIATTTKANASVVAESTCEFSLDLTPTANPLRPDCDLGDLSVCFDPNCCRIATDSEVMGHNSRVVVLDEELQHEYTMFCGGAKFYVMDRLRDHPHTFENGYVCPIPQTNPYVSTSFPVGRDTFTPDICIVRPGGSTFDAYFADAKIDVPGLIKFVLEEAVCNETRDGSEATAMGEQRHWISLGCCGQAYTQESEKGHKIPKATYGLGIFYKIEDPK